MITLVIISNWILTKHLHLLLFLLLMLRQKDYHRYLHCLANDFYYVLLTMQHEMDYVCFPYRTAFFYFCFWFSCFSGYNVLDFLLYYPYDHLSLPFGQWLHLLLILLLGICRRLVEGNVIIEEKASISALVTLARSSLLLFRSFYVLYTYCLIIRQFLFVWLFNIHTYTNEYRGFLFFSFFPGHLL